MVWNSWLKKECPDFVWYKSHNILLVETSLCRLLCFLVFQNCDQMIVCNCGNFLWYNISTESSVPLECNNKQKQNTGNHSPGPHRFIMATTWKPTSDLAPQELKNYARTHRNATPTQNTPRTPRIPVGSTNENTQPKNPHEQWKSGPTPEAPTQPRTGRP